MWQEDSLADGTSTTQLMLERARGPTRDVIRGALFTVKGARNLTVIKMTKH